MRPCWAKAYFFFIGGVLVIELSSSGLEGVVGGRPDFRFGSDRLCNVAARGGFGSQGLVPCGPVFGFLLMAFQIYINSYANQKHRITLIIVGLLFSLCAITGMAFDGIPIFYVGLIAIFL